MSDSNLNTMLRQQITHAYANAPAITQLMDSVGIKPEEIQTAADLSKIPVTSKDRLQELQQQNPPFGGFLGVPIKQLQRIYLSPGPIYDPHGLTDEAGELAAKEAFVEAGFNEDDIVINAFLYHMVPAGLLLDKALRLAGATVVPLGPGNTEVHIKVMMDLKVTGYAGVPSFLEIIYDKAAEMGIPHQAIPLKKAFFSAEPYTPSQREKFEKTYGLTTSQAYATADIGIIGYEKPSQQGLFIPRNIVVQVCDPQTGEELPNGELGEVVVTTLNPAYALIRMGTGDLSIMDVDGDTRKLRGWMGRSGEAIKVRGMFLHPNSIRFALAPYPNIKKWQAVVDRDGSRDQVTLQLILSEGNVDSDTIIQAVSQAARLTLNSVEVVDSVEGERLIRDARKFD